MNDLDPTQFLGLPSPGVEKADVVVLPAPVEKTVSCGKGAAGGPEAIIKATHQIEFFDEVTFVDFSSGRPACHTAAPLSGEPALQRCLEEIEDSVRRVSDRFVVALGGEHTITYGVLRGLIEFPGDLTVVQIDAHSDLIDTLDGRRWSHGTVMRRIHELGARLIQIGIRSLSKEEYDFGMQSERVCTFFDHEMPRRNPEMFELLGNLTGDVYLSVDVDGIDPSLIPSTGTPQPGGLSWETVTKIIGAISLSRAQWRGADIVEYIPSPFPPGCDMVPAKLLSRMIACRFEKVINGRFSHEAE